MNSIRQIQALNKKELENAVPSSASWHTDYRDTAYIYIGGLSFDLNEGDIVTIFSQFGEPVWVKLMRDKETGKSKGFAFLKYEDQKSTDLAVDNLGGATVLGRMLRVDHTRYKKRDDEEDDEERWKVHYEGEGEAGRSPKRRRTSESRSEDEEARPLIKEEIELQELLRNHDDEDPMKEYLLQEKKEEVTKALAKLKKSSKKDKEKSKKHRYRHRDRSDDRHNETRLAKRDKDEGRRHDRSSERRGHHDRHDDERQSKSHRSRRDHDHDSDTDNRSSKRRHDKHDKDRRRRRDEDEERVGRPEVEGKERKRDRY